MTVPFQYAHASEQFDRFLEEARVVMGHQTSHQAYQTVEGLLRVFRRRLTVQQALRFADVLPAVLRAMFVAEWKPQEAPQAFASLPELNAEVKAYRRDHNFSPDNAIQMLAPIIRRCCDSTAFERALGSMPPGARSFWFPD